MKQAIKGLIMLIYPEIKEDEITNWHIFFTLLIVAILFFVGIVMHLI
jgi:hypothetical protein